MKTFSDMAHIFGLPFFNQYACLNVSFRKISKVFPSFLATKNMMLVSFLKNFAVNFLSYDTCIFLFYGNNENELSLSQNIGFFLYIAGFFFKKKKKNLILSFFINMSKRIVPSKKRKAQDLVSQSPQVSPQVPPQGSSQSSSQVPPQGSPQVPPQGSSQVPPQGSSQVLPQGSSQVSSPSQVSKTSKTFEKIITQNAKILQKLDVLISSQKKIEERLEVPEINNEDLIKVIKSFSLYIIYLYTN
jgi:hypothetical protein